MKCTICKTDVTGKFYALVDIEHGMFPVCKECLVKYDKFGTRNLGDKIREVLKGKNVTIHDLNGSYEKVIGEENNVDD